MSQKPKKRRILKVQVSFEVSRVSDECLACADRANSSRAHPCNASRQSTNPKAKRANKGNCKRHQLFQLITFWVF